MARFDDAETILIAAAAWWQRCLIGEGSLFTDRPLWTHSSFRELHTLYVEKLDDESGDSFLVKLKRQLDPGSSDAKCLWAEMTWVYRLIQGRWSMGAATKRSRISEIWQWSGRDFPQGHKLLDETVLGAGVVNPGTAYNTLAWMEYRFFVVAMLKWYSLDRNERESFLTRPWDFASWLDDIQFAAGRMFRHAILYLLCPDHFEPIVSSDGKRRIVDRLYQGDSIDASKPVELDRALISIRQRLEGEYPKDQVHFYRSPIKELWQDPPPKPKPPPRVKKVREKERTGYRAATYTPSHAHDDLFLPPTHFDR
ncbi:MAG: hypothetical protein F4238_01500, partial [Gemmatimonadetes bacterium]|nr:hypothetical protein [Gemmatimonadota bacterium]